MPVQRPLNENRLWKGKVEQPIREFHLPKINTIVGGTIKDPSAPSIWEEINESYRKYSEAYWTRVKAYQAEYRRNQ
jgi:hypothetical protein